MDENGSFIPSDELKKRAEELIKKTEIEEAKRLEHLFQKAQEFSLMRNREFLESCKEKLKTAEQIYHKSRKELIEREKEIEKILRQERTKKAEAYRAQIEEKKRKEEEEKKRLEEEKKRKEEEELRRLEEEKKLKEELLRRKEEEEKLLKEEEERRKKEEIELKVQELLSQASEYLDQGNYDAALIEVAKALVHNPQHSEALDLKQKIKQIQEETQKTPEPEEVKSETKQEIVTQLPHQPVPLPGKKKRKLQYWAIIVLLAGVIGLAVYLFLPTLLVIPESIAVLPFKSESGKLEEDILGSAISEEVVNKLAYFKNLKVMGYESSLFISNSSINHNLSIFQNGFARVLEGKIKLTDDKAFVTISLKDTTANDPIQKEITCPKDKLYELPTQICQEISVLLKLKNENIDERAFRIPTKDNSAYQMYLRGIEIIHRKTKESINNAQQLFDYSASIDNGFVESFAMSGFASILKTQYNFDASEDNLKRARISLEKADITATNPFFVKSKLMLLNIYEKNFSSARDIFQTLKKQAFNNPELFTYLGKMNILTGNYQEAVDALVISKSFDPYNFETLRLLSHAYQLNGDYRSAYQIYHLYNPFIEDTSLSVMSDLNNIILNDPEMMMKYSDRLIQILERRIASYPNSYTDRYMLARIFQLNGKYSEAEPILINALDKNEREFLTKSNNINMLIYRALIYTRLGRFKDAVKFMDTALQTAPDNHRVLYKAAQMYAMQAGGNDTLYYDKKTKKPILKEFIRSIDYLQKAVDKHFDLNEILDVDFYNLRRTNEFLITIKVKGN